MVTYLSDEWLAEAAAALAADEALAAATGDVDLTVGYDVTDGPLGRRSYTLRFDHGTTSLVPGAVDPGVGEVPPVSFSVDYDTAVAIARGDTTVQVAFMQGRLKLGGDIGVLLTSGGALEGVADALAELRGRTEY